MKTISIIICILFSVNLISKEGSKKGYEYINDAEILFSKHKYKKAESALSKALNCGYGFCGNAWQSAYNRIYILKARIYNKKRDYDKALAVLDSIYRCGWGANCVDRDSLKVKTLILKFGKNKVIKAFNEVDTLSRTKEEGFEDLFYVHLSRLNYNFYFYPYTVYNEYNMVVIPDKDANDFKQLAKDLKFYKLLK